MEIFGDWQRDLNQVRIDFNKGDPFKYCVIDNFLTQDMASAIHDELQMSQYDPRTSHDWHVYKNPIEYSYSYDNLKCFTPSIKKVYEQYANPELIQILREITGIEKLEYDHLLHGAGITRYYNHGRLHVHLDYEKHPRLEEKERKLNIILYMSKNWNPEWNGATELFDRECTKMVRRVDCVFNRALIFQTNELSWHGIPTKIRCPEHECRVALNMYYISPLTTPPDVNKVGANEDGYRMKATFVKHPDTPFDSRMDKLYKIRSQRRIEPDDMRRIYPDWNEVDS
jgi:Rps23 Pro-64 3,4-dihydroxylase Tpa1-like proline 4-hydroxylase